MDPLEKAIRDHLGDYLAGGSTLNELQDWLIRATRKMDERASPSAVQLAYAIELVLAELSSGYLTPEQLRADLISIAESETVKGAAAVGA